MGGVQKQIDISIFLVAIPFKENKRLHEISNQTIKTRRGSRIYLLWQVMGEFQKQGFFQLFCDRDYFKQNKYELKIHEFCIFEKKFSEEGAPSGAVGATERRRRRKFF